ncbi:MAG: hypothetical protein KDK39_19850 [Leptospiraceae bacterium]|nr:hypothetical protein [Leptospiraceae bacterium]
MTDDEKQIRDELFEQIREMDLEYLQRQGPNLCYQHLKGITIKQGEEPTVANMIRYAGGLEMDFAPMYS